MKDENNKFEILEKKITNYYNVYNTKLYYRDHA